MKPKKKGLPVLWTALTAVSAVLVAVTSVGYAVTRNYVDVINKSMNLKSTKVIRTQAQEEKGVLFESDYDDAEALKKADMEVAERLTEEGCVLLKNKNNALPLSNTASITILGHQSTNMLVCGTGSADIDATLDTKKYGSKYDKINGYLNLKGAFEERTKVSVNEAVWDTYMGWTEKETYQTNPEKGDNSIRNSSGSMKSAYTINEPSWETLNSQKGVAESIATHKDAAIVVISRLGGEMYDIPSSPASKGNDEETVGGSGNSLELTVNELDLIHNAKQKFDKVIVLINSANALECDFLTDENSDVDAALWIGYVGLVGLYGVADVIVGNANPSGRLVDTYCNDNTTNPAMANFYSEIWQNAESLGAVYDAKTEKWKGTGLMTGSSGGDLDGNMFFNAYQEGIYVGYRYYETRYEDMVLGKTANYSYLKDVAYPFGYGLSYTTFEYGTPTFTDKGKSIEVKVDVKNSGEVAGKEVVEVYFQSEYTDFDKDNGIEKAAIELCGFDKTKLLAPGETETVTISVDKEEFKTYFTGANEGKGGYIMDAGDYHLTIGTDAHDALNNVLKAKGKNNMVLAGDKAKEAGNASNVYSWNVATVDYETYKKSTATGYTIENQFQEAQLSAYGESDMPSVSRKDWEGTFPTSKFQTPLTANMQKEMTGIKEYVKETVAGETMPKFGSKDTNYSLSDMTGLDYDDPKWDDLLDQITYKEACMLIGVGYHGTQGLESISKPETTDENGPQGFSASLTSITGKSTSLCAYTDENIMAATWNVELMEEVGEHIGEDGLHSGYSGLYGPAMNTHRTAYAGRNFEYYSEDGFLGGKIGAAEVKGIQSKGVYVFIKHFALNDCETNCRSIATFVNEQAIRELYLAPFEKAVVEGGAYNVMNAFARVGVVWTGAHRGLMTEVLRNEWGCRGFGISDYTTSSYKTSAHARGTYDPYLAVIAGTDTFDSSAQTSQADALLHADYENDVHLMNCIRQACHRISYVVANSNAMNAAGTVVLVMNWWEFAIIDGIIWSSVATVTFGLLTFIVAKKRKKNSMAAETVSEPDYSI